MASLGVLGADIGGTNTSIGVFSHALRPLLTLSFRTRETSPYAALKRAATLAKAGGIHIRAACVSVAGPVGNNKVKLTNSPYSLSMQGIRKASGIGNVHIINDFEAAAYGIDLTSSSGLIPLSGSMPRKNALKAVIGAGTGLGKALLYYDLRGKMYRSLPSEEGHTQIIIANKEELALLEFIKKRKTWKRETAAYWDDVRSGRGISMLYEYIIQKNSGHPLTKKESMTKQEIMKAGDKAAAISSHRKDDRLCREAFALFARFYARFARTTALSALPYGGLYIAGGIAAKNIDIFSSRAFKGEWENAGEMKPLLAKIPLFAVKDTALGVRGAAWCAANR